MLQETQPQHWRKELHGFARQQQARPCVLQEALHLLTGHMALCRRKGKL